jgi:hypothetical protein
MIVGITVLIRAYRVVVFEGGNRARELNTSVIYQD